MSEEVFRIVITIGVALIVIAFIAQSVFVLALLGVAKKVQSAAAPVLPEIQPMLHKLSPLADHALAMVEAAKPVLERVGPLMDTAKPVIAKVGPLLDTAKPAVARSVELIGAAKETVTAATTTANKVNDVLASVRTLIDDSRPKVAQISEESVAIVRSGREQVERLGDLLEDAAGRARHRLEQIDHSVDNTLGQLNQTGENVKKAVLRPVREVNGFSAGIAAAVSTLVHGRKSSVETATQDEEMFI